MLRICWREQGKPKRGIWLSDAPEDRKAIEQAVKVANDVYGADSHWIEEREEVRRENLS